MSDSIATPLSPMDLLTQRLQKMEQELEQFKIRDRQTNEALLSITNVLQKSEAAFHVRVTKSLANVFSSMAHSLEHALQEHAMPQDERTIKITAISEEEALQDKMAIFVKRTGDHFDFSLAQTPDNIQNAGTEGIISGMKEMGLLETDGSMYIKIEVVTHVPAGAPDDVVEQPGQPAD